MHFTYGVSNAQVEDQYAVDVSTYRGVDGGVGNDWGCGRLLPNSSTGLLPGVAQGGWYTIGPVPASPSGNVIRITGYGTAAVDSRSQKTHTGALDAVNTSSLRYVPDTTGGNSGSPVLHENKDLSLVCILMEVVPIPEARTAVRVPTSLHLLITENSCCVFVLRILIVTMVMVPIVSG